MKRLHPRGSLLLEVLVACSIGVVFALTIASVVSANSRLLHTTRSQTQAVAYAKESMERMYAAKDADWDSITSVETGYILIFQQGNAYAITSDTGTPPGEMLDGGMTRTILLERGKRNAAGNIADEGVEDGSTRKITVSVTYKDHDQNRTVTLSGYVAKWKGN